MAVLPIKRCITKYGSVINRYITKIYNQLILPIFLDINKWWQMQFQENVKHTKKYWFINVSYLFSLYLNKIQNLITRRGNISPRSFKTCITYKMHLIDMWIRLKIPIFMMFEITCRCLTNSILKMFNRCCLKDAQYMQNKR